MHIEEERYDEAAVNYREAIDLNPEFHQAYYNLALVYAQMGDLENAESSIDKAIELEPNDETYQEMAKTIHDATSMQ